MRVCGSERERERRGFSWGSFFWVLRDFGLIRKETETGRVRISREFGEDLWKNRGFGKKAKKEVAETEPSFGGVRERQYDKTSLSWPLVT